MGFEEVAAWLLRALSYLGVMVSSLSAMVLLTAAAPGFVERERVAARRGLRRCFLWGAVFVVNCVLVAALLALDGAVGRLVALGLLVVLLVVALAGLAAVATEVGRRVLALGDDTDPTTLGALATGTIVLFVTAVVPVFGWLVFTSALLLGIGAFLETAAEDARPTRRRSRVASSASNPAVPR